MWQVLFSLKGLHMIKSARVVGGKLLVEQAVSRDAHRFRDAVGARVIGPLSRSHTVNLGDSPLGWLFARGHVDQRQFDAGERLRVDWERSQLDPQVTMRWDAAPIRRGRGGQAVAADPCQSKVDARARFMAAVDGVGPGLSDIAWRIICAGEGMRQAETALGWPARAGKLVLGLALDRIADHYRLPKAPA